MIAEEWVNALAPSKGKDVTIFDRYGRKFEGVLIEANERMVVIKSTEGTMFLRPALIARAEVHEAERDPAQQRA